LVPTLNRGVTPFAAEASLARRVAHPRWAARRRMDRRSMQMVFPGRGGGARV